MASKNNRRSSCHVSVSGVVSFDSVPSRNLSSPLLRLPPMTMSNIRTICASFINHRGGGGGHARLGLGLGLGFGPFNGVPSLKMHSPPCSFASFETTTSYSSSFVIHELPRMSGFYRSTHRRTLSTRVSNWNSQKSPYETLELERDADEEKIKTAYRRLAKFYHPDVYDGRGTLEEGETAETRFIKIQAAYELLIDQEKRRQYDLNHRVNPMKASQAWMEWLMKKRKAFDQRGDMAISAWAEQQQLEMTLRARHLTRSKVDPEEERKLLAKEKAAYKEFFNTTLKRHTLVLRKRDIMRRKAEEEKKKILGHLLALEGLELDTDDEDESK